MSFGNFYHPTYPPGFGSKPRLQSIHPFRNLAAAGSNANNYWSGAGGHTDYGLESPDYDYHSGPSGHVPSGGSYSYHATGGTGYGPPAVHHAIKTVSSSGGGGKKSGGGGKSSSSALSALTLLSFFFFINLLQGCIKDHMDAMNPTVMVMTTNVIRNRFNKMGDINSREQNTAYTSNEANIVMQPVDLLASAAVQSPSIVEATRPSVSLQSPYSNNQVSPSKPPEQALPRPSPQYINNRPQPEVTISYAKPQYVSHFPDPYDHLTQPQHTLLYGNQSLVAKPPPYKWPPLEQQYNYHHSEYIAQSPPQPSVAFPQYSSPPNPFYQHRHQVADKPGTGVPNHNDDKHLDYDMGQKYDVNHQQQQQNYPYSQNSYSSQDHPWSSNAYTSSVLSGPFRRATIVAVTPKTKWITVPAKITDRTQFDTSTEDVDEEKLEHHNDREAFNRRFNSN